MIFGDKTTIERIAEREMALWEQKRGLLAELAVAEKAAGEALADGQADGAVDGLISLKTRIGAIDLGITTLRARRGPAFADRFAEEARKVRDQISEKRKQLSAIESRTAKLLKQLADIEGVQYTQAILSCETAGPNQFYQPKSEGLVMEIRQLESRASSIESQGVTHSGAIDLEDADDSAVIRAVLLHPSEAPTAEAVAAFLSDCDHSNRQPGRDFTTRPRRVHIQWSRGEIDLSASYIQNASGTFRAPIEKPRTFSRFNPLAAA